MQYTSDMVRSIVVSALIVSASVVAGLVRAQADQAITRHYYVEVVRFPPEGFPSAGTLDLTFHDNGRLTGLFKPQSGPGISPVTGQLQGTNIYIAIGGSDPLRVNGTFADGIITGRAFRTSDTQLYNFRGLPIPNDNATPSVPKP